MSLIESVALLLERHLHEEPRRKIRLDRDVLALQVADRLDRLVGRPAVAAGRKVDRADDDALRLLAAAEALILADGAEVAVDVAALHGGDGVRHVVVEDLLDGDALHP